MQSFHVGPVTVPAQNNEDSLVGPSPIRYWLRSRSSFTIFISLVSVAISILGIYPKGLSMKSKVQVRSFVVMLNLIILSTWSGIGSGQDKPDKVDCDIHAGPCRAAIKGTEVSLEISPKPVKAMQDLTFTVSFAGEKPGANPYIDLGMPGMNMGRNRVTLKPAGESVFQGNGVIVR